MKCTDCKYCVAQDVGYTNYTMEGTMVDCLLGLNPGFPEDNFYGEEPTLLYAENCRNFIAGDHPQIDVIRENGFPDGYSEDHEIRQLLKKWDAQTDIQRIIQQYA